MTWIERGEVREILRDASIVLYKEWVLCRSMAIQLLMALIPSFMLLFMQLVPFVYALIHPGATGPMWEAILSNAFKSATITVGPALILITAASLGSVTIARDRFGGALEGTLATPLSTAGLWIGKTITHWGAGGLFYLVLCLVLWGCVLLMPSSLIDVGWGEVSSFVGELLLLSVVTLLLVALITLIQLGAPPMVAVIATTLPILVILLLSYYIMDGLFKARAVPIAPALAVKSELLAIPVFLILILLLAPRLLRREAILLKSR